MMTKTKKVLKIIIITVLIFVLLSFSATKIIYDSCFPRYECTVSIDSKEIKQLMRNMEKAVAGDISGAMGILRTVLSSTEDHSKKEVPHGK